jgi:hypothetical protein
MKVDKEFKLIITLESKDEVALMKEIIKNYLLSQGQPGTDDYETARIWRDVIEEVGNQ